MTPAKPGKTRNRAGRKVVFALSKESPCSESLGLQRKAYSGSVFPHQPAGGCPLPRRKHGTCVSVGAGAEQSKKSCF